MHMDEPESGRKSTKFWRTWRDGLPVHPAADLLPLMSETDPAGFKALAEDIKEHGITVPIVLWTEAPGSRCSLLDGRNRLDAMELAGIKITANKRGVPNDVLCTFRYGFRDKYSIGGEFTDTDPYAYVISANIHRRHLTAEQKRELITKLLKATPEKSNRQIAETVKASHNTVGAVRAEMESTGQIDQLKKTTGKDGKARKLPAKKPAKKKRRTPEDFQRDIAAKQAANDVPAGSAETDIESFAKRLVKNDPAGTKLLINLIAIGNNLRLLAAILKRELEDIPEFLRRPPAEPAP